MVRIRRAAFALVLVACSSTARQPGLTPEAASPAREGAPAADAPPPSPPELRLPQYAKPVRYDLDLTIVPSGEVFQGKIGIDIELMDATSELWLNATDLTLGRARLTVGEQTYDLRALEGNEDFAGFAAPTTVGPGRGRLTIDYSGKLDSERSQGIYREQEGDAWYAYTFFEPIDARRAFPCFDEPNYKVPWHITLHVPADHVARANAPITGERPEANGMKAVEFAESKPLPSYLVAFVVGPFDVIDAPSAGQNGTRLQFIVPRGRGAETRYAAEATPRIVALLEQFFDMPYPYEKLDVAVVPRFWGTMEHPGIVAMGQPLTLIKPDQETIWRKQRYANVAIHELAHYWFGDYVTMAWWNDTWLNEALATWLDIKLTDAFEPSWEYSVDMLGSRGGAMSTDSLPTAKKIREPILTKHDIADSFDNAITYAKGAQVLAMFEAWVGPDRFAAALRAYLREFAWANADAEGFLRVMSREHDPALGPAFKTFLDQPGVPLVTADVDCSGEPALVLSQRQFVPAGLPPSDRQWQIPVCVKYGVGKSTSRMCVLLADETARVPLEGGKCPAWMMANDGATGYYRVAYPEPWSRKLLAVQRKALTITERVAALNDYTALAQTGEVSAQTVLDMVIPIMREGNRHLIEMTVGMVGYAYRLAPDELAPNFARFVRAAYGKRARAVGWKPKPGESQSMAQLRPLFLSLVAGPGRDPKLRKQAVALARKYLTDRTAVDPMMSGTVLYLAAHAGDSALFDAYLAEARRQTDHREVSRFLSPLGAFGDPALIKRALALLLDPTVDLRDSRGILYAASGHDDHPEVAYEFVRDNFAALIARMRPGEAAALSVVIRTLCDDAEISTAEREFADKFKAFDGGPRTLANALDRARTCAGIKRIQESSVEAFLRKW